MHSQRIGGQRVIRVDARSTWLVLAYPGRHQKRGFDVGYLPFHERSRRGPRRGRRDAVTAMTGTDARVAIVIASRNRRDLLLRTLSRHLALPERPRVVLVDNASTDGSPDAVLAQRPGVEVIRLERNIGGAAR